MNCLAPRWIPIPTALLFPGAALLLLSFPGRLYGKTWNVHADGSGDAVTIQAGINSAATGDTVLVWPGTYYENVDFLGKDIVLLAKFGPEVTTIDGSRAADPVISLENGESRAATVEGFTITGGRGSTGYGPSTRGGGIMSYRSSPTIRGNRIVNNRAEVGAGIAMGSGLVVSPLPFPLVEGNLFAENSADDGNGGGLSIEHVSIIVRKNVFRENSCTYDGGAVKASLGVGSGTFTENQFFDNEAGDHGGGLYLFVPPANPAPMTVESNLFVRNAAYGLGGGDTGSGGGVGLSEVSGTFANNTLVANVGQGESLSNGGGLLLRNTRASLEVEGNIFALNEGSGIGCAGEVLIGIRTNLFWQNTVGDVGGGDSTCPLEWSASQIIADPLFCNPATDDFRVASNSPALTGEEVMGAYGEPGCGPGVPVRRTTWGTLKALYR